MELCARCDRRATDEIWCRKHYNEYLNEWACSCGEINEGKTCWLCGKSPA